jgi:ribonuclease Z
MQVTKMPFARSLASYAALFFVLTGCMMHSVVRAEPCLEITLTGTMGGPVAVNGLAGAGTLVSYGDTENNCSDILLQFDSGRGTVGRLSELEVSPLQLDAVFITHMHSDHIEGLAGILQYRWHFLGEPLDVVCSADVSTEVPPPGRTMSCAGYLTHTGDAFIASGEIAQRSIENKKRDPAGPVTKARLKAVELPLPVTPGTIVWQQGEVQVSAIASTHIPGHLSYRVDSPAGSVVIGGDAGNSKAKPPRASSSSETVELLANGADVLVHSVIHPVFAPGAGSSFSALTYYRQSTATDLGAMAQRAGVKNLMFTHMIPALGATSHGPFALPVAPLSEEDFESAARDGQFTGAVYVGHDLLSLRLLQDYSK